MENINGVALPIRSYVFSVRGAPIYVFYCRWEAGAKEDAYVAYESARSNRVSLRFNLVREIWAGRVKYGQKILGVSLTGCSDADQAKAAVVRQLQTLIRVEKPMQNADIRGF